MSLLRALNLPRITRPRPPGLPQEKGPPQPTAHPRTKVVEKVKEAVSDALLRARVRAADDQMNAALSAANSLGNPLNSKTQASPESSARKHWQAGMVTYWQPGSAARQQALGLQGEARIAKAQQAAALLANARVVFQQGLQQLG